MFLLILMTLLWPAIDNISDGGETKPHWSCYHKNKQYCLLLSQREISAEVGLCVVIPCTFKTPTTFVPTGLEWYKCFNEKCTESVIISKSNHRVRSSFSGRVSLLEPDLSQRNCSIIINDLQLSDSGEYWLRVKSSTSGFLFSSRRATISVKTLQQKPSVLSPALTEGQRASLTCTAPGLCAGSEPTFTWTWRGAGHAPPTITAATTDRLTPVNHRHRSTLELVPSAELHAAEFSCKVSYNHGTISTQDSVRINVNYVKEIEVRGDTAVKEGDSLNVTCSVDSFPPSRLTWFGPNKTSLTVPETTERSIQTDLGSASLLIRNVTQAQSGQYMCEGFHLNSSQTKDINITVKYLKRPVLSGDTSVEEGGVLNLTCTVESFPPSIVAVRKLKDKVTEQNEANIMHRADPGSAGLVIVNVTPENAGIYECTVQHELKHQTTHMDIKVLYMREPVIFGDTSVKEGDVMNLTCTVDSFPLSKVFVQKVGSGSAVHNKGIRHQHGPGTANVVIENVTRGDAGRYLCTGLSQIKTLTTYVEVKLMWTPRILNSSGCVLDRDVLTCTCVSRASPVPTVTWPLLRHLSEYTLVTAVTGDTVNSSVVLRASGRNITGVQCFSSNSAGQVQESFTPSMSTVTAEREDSLERIFQQVFRLEVLLAFGLGFLLSAALCYSVIACCRRKQRNKQDDDFTVTLGKLNGNAREAANANTDLLHYANIDFVAMLNQETINDTMKTEYAEIEK